VSGAEDSWKSAIGAPLALAFPSPGAALVRLSPPGSRGR